MNLMIVYHVDFVDYAVVDTIQNAMKCHQQHCQVANPSVVLHRLLEGHIDHPQDG